MQAHIEGKNCIVTGANSGIGYAAAEGLASRFEFLTMPRIDLPLLWQIGGIMFYFIVYKFDIDLFLCFCSGATVYIVCRNKERGEAALSKIQSATGNKNVHLEVFGSLSSSVLFVGLNWGLLVAFLACLIGM